MNGPAQSGEPITAAGIEDLKAELAELEGPKRQEMARRIKAARDEGMRFLRESAVERVMDGLTTLREINKVTFVE